MLESVATAVQAPAKSRTGGAKKYWSRAKGLTHVDKRTVTWKRICELQALFTGELVRGGVELTDMRRYLVQAAAEAVALAEHGRGKFLREGGGDLSDVVSAERRADAAVRRLGLPVEGVPADQRQQSGQAAPAPDLSQQSGDQLDRLYVLLAEAGEGGADRS
jgi:hypothetical protein